MMFSSSHWTVYPSVSGRMRYAAMALGAACLVPATIGVIAGILGWLPHDPLEFVGLANEGPSSAHMLGCDALGRDLISRLGAAAAYFTPPGALAMAVALVLG